MIDLIKPDHTFEIKYIASRQQCILAVKKMYDLNLGAAVKKMESLPEDLKTFEKYEHIPYYEEYRLKELVNKGIIEITKTPLPLRPDQIQRNNELEKLNEEYKAAMLWYDGLTEQEKKHVDTIGQTYFVTAGG